MKIKRTNIVAFECPFCKRHIKVTNTTKVEKDKLIENDR